MTDARERAARALYERHPMTSPRDIVGWGGLSEEGRRRWYEDVDTVLEAQKSTDTDLREQVVSGVVDALRKTWRGDYSARVLAEKVTDALIASSFVAAPEPAAVREVASIATEWRMFFEDDPYPTVITASRDGAERLLRSMQRAGAVLTACHRREVTKYPASVTDWVADRITTDATGVGQDES